MKFTCITAGWRVEGVKTIIECVKNQDYPQKDIQHIIINDNNKDLRKWLGKNKYFENDPRIFVIDLRVRTHWFGCYARNVGVQVAYSYIKESHRDYGNEFIVFMDDDNYFTKNHLKLLARGHDEAPGAPLIGVDFLRIGTKDKKHKKHIRCQPYADLCDLGSFAYRTDMFDKYGYFRARKEKKFKFDFEFIKKIADGEGRENIKIMHTDNPTFHFYHKKY
jgi:cellulose synthase/poly-beta-1,6-N-acetylglucosamine synthase-like glycosyltransferase